MRYRTPDAFRDALEQRLRNEARETGAALMRLRKRVAFERFLARLATAAPERWMLKGAFALELRFGLRTRTTKDIDLARSDDEDAATEDLQATARLELGDFFSYRVRRTPALDDAAGFHAVRYTVVSELAGRRFEQFPLDVALGETATLEPDSLESPAALAFAGLESPRLPVVALEQHTAEKVYAYTGTYGPDDRESNRAKDLVDLVLIADCATPNAALLRKALRATFDRRARQPLPDALPPPPPAWARAYAEQAKQVGLPTELGEAHSVAAALLDPVLRQQGLGHWDSRLRRWIDEAEHGG